MRLRARYIAALAGILAATSVFVPSGSAIAADSVHVATNVSSASSKCRFDAYPSTADANVAVVSPAPAAIAGTIWVKGVQTGGGNSPYCRRFLAPLQSNLAPSSVSESTLRVELRTTATAPFVVYYAGSKLPGSFPGSFTAEWQVPVVTDPLVIIHAEGNPQGTATNPVHADYLVRLTQRVDGTAPVVTPAPDRTPNGDGWYDAPVGVTWNAVDPQPGTGLADAAPHTQAALEGDNTYTSPSICDRAGNCSTGSIGLRIDTVDPIVTPALGAAANEAGWFDEPVTITWETDDETSGVAAMPSPTIADVEGTQTYASAPACDRADNCTVADVELSIDTVAPTIDAVVSEAPNADGWFDDHVTIEWVAQDGTSGLVAAPEPTLADVEGTHTYTREVCDLAGNCATGSVELSIDTGDPTVVGEPDRAADHGEWYHGPVTIEWDAEDAVSGIAEEPADSVADLEGTNTYRQRVCDLAGHCATAAVELSIDTVDPAGTVGAGPAGVMLSLPGLSTGLSGTASDATSGVAAVTAAYTTDEGATVVEEATVTCTAGSCTWSAATPTGGGLYRSSVVITDGAGRAVTLVGPQVLVLGAPE